MRRVQRGRKRGHGFRFGELLRFLHYRRSALAGWDGGLFLKIMTFRTTLV